MNVGACLEQQKIQIVYEGNKHIADLWRFSDGKRVYRFYRNGALSTVECSIIEREAEN